MSRIRILDTTLRDGAQAEGIFFSLSDKLGIVMLLDNIGVDYIELGGPGFNPKDRELFEAVKNTRLEHAKLVAFGATRRKGSRAQDDAQLKALLEAETEHISIVGKSSASQVETVLRTSPDENLAMIAETVAYLKAAGSAVFFDAEHFFDGYRENANYALRALDAAASAGADALVLCDTRGGVFPNEAYAITKAVVERFGGLRIAAHFHNDIGCAVANSIESARAGARDIQGTFLGIGERCGNTSLSALVPSLQLKLGYEVASLDQLRMYTPTARHMADLCNMVVPSGAPYVGQSAFTHKGGMHIDGVVKSKDSFEHLEPELVGNTTRLVLSEMAGRSAVMEKLEKIDPALAKDDAFVDIVLQKVKQLELDGYQFESASASFEAMVLRLLGRQREHYRILSYSVSSERTIREGSRPAMAVVKLEVDGSAETMAAEGDGPVHALDTCLRKALLRFYPELKATKLVDYRVRVTEPHESTASKVRVLIDSSDGETSWTTVGLSADIIEASFEAINDSIVYVLNRTRKE